MSTRQRLWLAVRLGNWRQSPLLITKYQRISKSLQLWMRFIFFIHQLFLWLQRIHHRALALTTYDKFLNLSDGMHAFFHTTNNNFKPGIVSYPNYWKTLPRMSQWIHNVAEITRFFATFPAALLVKSCTLLTSSSIKQRRFSRWLPQAEISLVYSMNKHQRRWLVLLQQTQQLHIWTELCEMPPAVQPYILWLVHTTA